MQKVFVALNGGVWKGKVAYVVAMYSDKLVRINQYHIEGL